jgi:deoxycytidine triphosphate deaminase
MVLARDEIQELIRQDRLKIGNFDPEYLEPATYDMRLGNDAFVVSSHTAVTRDLQANPILVIGASELPSSELTRHSSFPMTWSVISA